MKAISMMQPYAWLFSNGYLTIDDRTWPLRYRGEIAIHASKQFHRQYYDFLCQNTTLELPSPADFEQGGVVGIAELTGCLQPVTVSPSKLNIRRSHFGTAGFYGFVFEQARCIPFQPCRGNRGLFDVELGCTTAPSML